MVWEYHYKLESKLKKPDSHTPWIGYEERKHQKIFKTKLFESLAKDESPYANLDSKKKHTN